MTSIARAAAAVTAVLVREGVDYAQSKVVFKAARARAGRLAGPERRGGVDRLTVEGKLYEIEADIRGRPAEHRKQARQERSRPIVEALHAWLHDHVGRVSAASGLAEAIWYAIRHWPGLVVFLDDGGVEMDTNPVERAIGPIALKRKNTLFAGSDGSDGSDGGARHWTVAMIPNAFCSDSDVSRGGSVGCDSVP